MMRFQKLSVFGTAWSLKGVDDSSQDIDSTPAVQAKRRMFKGKKPAPRENRPSTTGSGLSSSGTLRASDGQIKDDDQHKISSLLLYMSHNPDNALVKKAELFLLSIALCHTCLPEVLENGTIEFQAVSPDELALVNAAQEMGYMLVDRQAGSISLRTPGLEAGMEPLDRVFDVLDVIEFSSKRKRMSIIVREQSPSGRIMVITKGADSSVIPLLRLSELAYKKADAVEQRAQERSSAEAHQAILRRNSEHVSRKSSLSRTSLNLARSSIGGATRHSFNPNRMQPIRDELDNWLAQQESSDPGSSTRGSTTFTPRWSAGGHPSGAGLEPRNSLNIDHVQDLFGEAATFSDATIFEKSFEHLNDFANQGLRTLLYGYRYLIEDEYQLWKKLYNEATTSLVNRQDKIEEIAQSIESALELAGVTAIEDRLQQGVPEAIEKLRRANIALWMLTGDKRETAINVGHSCRLIKDFSSITILDHEKGDLERHAAAAIIIVSSGKSAHSVVVVDGKTLSIITANTTLKSLFYDLAIIVDTVICCRASPSQKAMLVRAIRRRVNHSITLAIGDGANDIAMIQEAHVGIGITGKEGMQAARTSDYSIAQFRFLLKLLLVHGRWNYIRICSYTLGTFWKEFLFYLTQALYQNYAGHTGTSLYESWSLSMFNTLFTSLPVIFLGIFKKDLSASTLLAVPELYKKGQRSAGFNFKVYFGWTFVASVEAIIVFNIMLRMYGRALFTKDNGLYAMGVMTFSAIVILIAIKLL
jgi:phospholipid-translocating ATPase